MRRELGLPTGQVRSALDLPSVEASTISGSVQNPGCLVKPVLNPGDKEGICQILKQISELLKNPGLDYRTLHGELEKCCKAGWQVDPKSGTFVKRSTVILGIKRRARNILTNDPTYEEQQIKELDRILEENIKRLFYCIWCTENGF
jgi:hypothetical protein